jgi:hypothetical protein
MFGSTCPHPDTFRLDLAAVALSNRRGSLHACGGYAPRSPRGGAARGCVDGRRLPSATAAAAFMRAAAVRRARRAAAPHAAASNEMRYPLRSRNR